MILSLNGIIAGKSENIVTSGLILNLDASNSSSYIGSGTAWNDLSGNGNHATLINGVGYSSIYGGVMLFDGVDDYAQVNSFTTPSSFTLSTWVNIDYSNSDTYARIVEKGLNNDFTLCLNKVSSANLNTFQLGDGNTLLTSNINSNFQYITVTVDNTGGNNYTVTYYLNGVYKSIAGINIVRNTSQPLYIGSNPLALAVTSLFGQVGQVIMYNRVISNSEDIINFNKTKTKFGL